MLSRTTVVAGAILFSYASFCLAGGVELTFETKDMRKKDTAWTQKMYVSGQKVAMQISSGQSRAATMIFRGDKELAWSVNHEQKEYIEMTKESMDELGQTMNSAMAQMKEQMANMPPEQRAMMEKMLQGQLGGAQGAPPAESRAVTYKKTGEKKTVSGYPCVKYDVLRGKEKVREMWVAPWNGLKDLKETSAAFEAMGKFFQKILESFKDNPFYKSMDNPYSGTSELQGFPVVSTEIDNGVPTHEMTLKRIVKTTVSENLFTVPAGYKKNSMTGQPGKPEE